MIDHPDLLSFCNESIRTIFDNLATLVAFPDLAINTVIGKDLLTPLGAKASDLFRAEPWTNEDYAAIPVEDISGSGNGGRTTLTNHDVIAALRVMIVLKGMMAQNPALGPLIGKIAVNPRPLGA